LHCLEDPDMSLLTLRRAAPALMLALPLGLGSLAAQAQAQAQAQAPMASTQHATRSGMAFTELEEQLLKAQREHRADAIGQMLGDDFQMVVAQEGGATVPREDWLESAIKPGAGAWVVSQLSTHDFGTVAQVSFVLRASPARAGTAPLAVVDTWQKAGDGWRLVVRHVANAAGPRKGIPGDAPTRAVIKKY
jgi:hypothetical protein